MNEQTHSTEETTPSEKTNEKIDANTDAKPPVTETNNIPSGQEVSGQVDLEQMYNMLKERDEQIKGLTSEVSTLKKTNTELLLKVNSASSTQLKSPYESFVDEMLKH